MAGGLIAVVAFLNGDRVERDHQGPLAGDPGSKSPGAISSGWAGLAAAGEGEARRWGAAGPAGRIVTGRIVTGRVMVTGRPGSHAVCGPGVVLGFGAGAAVAGGVSLLVGDGNAPGGLGIGGGRAGQVPGQRRGDGPEADDLAR